MNVDNLWFTADTHFGHEKILTYTKRPWPTLEAMNEGLVERWNATVKPEDTVILLGDAAMGKREDSLKYLKRCRGYKILVPGNHDNCWDKGRDAATFAKDIGTESALRRTAKHVKLYQEWGGIAEVWQPPIVYEFGGRTFLLTHMPDVEAGDHTSEVRFEAVRPRPPHEGEWMLCGHVHEAWLTLNNRINVGVDVWNYTPVSANEILAITR